MVEERQRFNCSWLQWRWLGGKQTFGGLLVVLVLDVVALIVGLSSCCCVVLQLARSSCRLIASVLMSLCRLVACVRAASKSKILSLAGFFLCNLLLYPLNAIHAQACSRKKTLSSLRI